MSEGFHVTRVGVAQMCSGEDVEANLEDMTRLVDEAVASGAGLVMLPEGFAYLGAVAGRLAIAESLERPGPILGRCQALAREHRVHLLLGGFPEAADAQRTYNTCLMLDPNGAIVARYRKIHLFDVDLADGTRLQESASTAPGEDLTTARLGCGVLGLSICYDLRFPTLYQRLVDMGATMLTVPSAFTPTTGAAHWHVLLRARAIECQAWVLAPAQVGEHGGGRVSFGHALVVDPWGRVVADAGTEVSMLMVDIDPELVRRSRVQLPSLDHRRLDPAPATAAPMEDLR